MGERDQLVRGPDHRGHRVEIDPVVGGQRHDVDLRPPASCQGTMLV